jgi:hypothetical protein
MKLDESLAITGDDRLRFDNRLQILEGTICEDENNRMVNVEMK